MNKRGKFLNKKNVDRIFYGMMVFTIVLMIEYFVIYLNNSLDIPMGIEGNAVFWISAILLIFGMLIACILQVTYLFKEAILHVSRYEGKQCFEKIECLYRNLGDCNGYYQGIIREINQVYKADIEIETMINERDLESLYARKSYLENGLDSHSNIMQVLTSAGVSLIVALANYETGASIALSIFYTMVAVVGVVLCCIAKYIEKGRGGSYLYNTYEYELELLNKKIDLIQYNLETNEAIERIIQMRQVIINTLCDLYSHGKRRRKTGLKKKTLVDMAKEMYDLPLLQDINRNDVVWGKRKIHNVDCFFPAVTENKQIKCLNEHYERVCEIINAIS